MNEKKYLLIDTNNLCARHAFAHTEMVSSTGIPTAVHYGLISTLVNMKQKFPSHSMLLVWDGKSKRRMTESEEGVKLGIVPEAYKENRKKLPTPQPLKDFYSQAPFLQRGISQTGIPQIRMPDFEADDVIAAYATLLKPVADDIICLTSDADYYQLLSDNIRIWDGKKMAEITIDTFRNEWGIEPNQWVDKGSLEGDVADNIFGVPGWGWKTSLKAIKKYGSWEKVIKAYKDQNTKLRITYMDLKDRPDGEQKFKYLSEKKSEKERLVYPEITFDMPFTGVLLAMDQDEITLPKSEIMALMFEKRIKLAYSLKKMDCDIPDLPEFEKQPMNKDRLLEYLDYYDIQSVKSSIELFV